MLASKSSERSRYFNANTFAFLWGFAEGSYFFLVPDILLTYVALFSLRQSLRALFWIVAGSLVAGTLMFCLGKYDHDLTKRSVLKVPFVSAEMFERVGEDFRHHGAVGLLKGPLSGIPYKVYATEAAEILPYWLFLLVSIPARVERLIFSWAIFFALAQAFKKQIDIYPLPARLFHALYWLGVYAIYWGGLFK